MSAESLNLTLKIWRQKGPASAGGFETYPMRSCVNAALERFPFRPGERDMVQVAPIDAQLGFSGSDSLVVFVLFNLLKNALFAIQAEIAERGDKVSDYEGRVEISATSEAGWCVLRFSDNGCGIPADILPRVFDPFYSTKSHGRGTGMGLTFCRRVAEALGGTIACESEPHVHTTFTIRLPEPGTSADRALHDAPAKPRRWPAGQDFAG